MPIVGRRIRCAISTVQLPGIGESLARSIHTLIITGQLPVWEQLQGETDPITAFCSARFNPTHEAWLPVLHTQRGQRHYTVLLSNTAHAHRLGKTHDWVVLYCDDDRGE